jgi:hypothetical protein
MCSLCGVLQNEHWTDTGTGRRARVVRSALLERVLGAAGLTVREWAGQYVVGDGKGRSEVVSDLAGVWIACERLTGRRLDALDPQLIERLAS